MDELWEKFYKSGNVFDYLAYKRRQEVDDSVNLQRPCTERAADRGK